VHECVAAGLQRKRKDEKALMRTLKKRTASSALVMHSWKDNISNMFCNFFLLTNTPCRTKTGRTIEQYLFYTFCC